MTLETLTILYLFSPGAAVVVVVVGGGNGESRHGCVSGKPSQSRGNGRYSIHCCTVAKHTIHTTMIITM